MNPTLDLMFYQTYPPSPRLSEFVRNYTYIHFQFGEDQQVPVKQRSPKPEQKIVFYLKGSVRLPGQNTNQVFIPPPVAVYSNQIERRSLHVTSQFQAFIIFFHPGVLHRMIRVPMPEFHPRYSDAELYFGSEVRTVRERLANLTDIKMMIDVVEQFLLARFREVTIADAVDIVAASVLTNPSAFSLDAMADQACLSTRQFYRKFLLRVGISPKLFSRLARFNQAYQYKLAHPAVTWSSVASMLSYTDYHHLEKEFKEFIGVTPEQWIKAELAAPERIFQLR